MVLINKNIIVNLNPKKKESNPLANLLKILISLQDLFFPPVCACCQGPLLAGEDVICTPCVFNLPKTNFHLLHSNPVAEKFKGRIPVQFASSFLYFIKGGKVQSLIHQLKYKDKEKIGIYLGELFAEDLTFYHKLKNIDSILAVPLHPSKKKKRGYNQSQLFAKGINKKTGITLAEEDTVVKVINTTSQTQKDGIERLANVRDVFSLKKKENVFNKNILLVDDVLTTGATIESCALEVLKGEPKSISIVTIAFASAH